MRPDTGSKRSWTTSPTVKEKNAAQRAVTALLDILAPEAAIRRTEPPRLRIERHRTPDGCVLQAANAALSVSWFPDASEEAALGELHVILWRGTVVRRGAPHARGGAQVVDELVLRPIEQAAGDHVWRALSGEDYTIAELAMRCNAMLEEQIAAE